MKSHVWLRQIDFLVKEKEQNAISPWKLFPQPASSLYLVFEPRTNVGLTIFNTPNNKTIEFRKYGIVAAAKLKKSVN